MECILKQEKEHEVNSISTSPGEHLTCPREKHACRLYVFPDRDILPYRTPREHSTQVLLISDPETKSSAAAMDVHVGHFSDPGTAACSWRMESDIVTVN